MVQSLTDSWSGNEANMLSAFKWDVLCSIFQRTDYIVSILF